MSAPRPARGRLESALPEMPLKAVPAPSDEAVGAAAEPSEARPVREPKPRAVCPLAVCDGGGWIVDDNDVATPCECRAGKIEKARAKGVSATLPKRYRGVSFDRPPVTEMARGAATRSKVAEVRGFCDEIDARLDEGRGLWIQGGTGTGKTTLAMLVSKAALDAGRTAAIYSLPGLLARIRRTFDGEAGEDTYFTFFNRLISVDLLHLDDLGAENRTEWVLEQLYAIIDRRYSDQRSILVTTNLSERELREQLGERITSRLVEVCGDPLELPGDDRRVQISPGVLGYGSD
ncbi:MAG: ATP-binding protein [Solirubrobacterales bacterium]